MINIFIVIALAIFAVLAMRKSQFFKEYTKQIIFFGLAICSLAFLLMNCLTVKLSAATYFSPICSEVLSNKDVHVSETIIGRKLTNKDGVFYLDDRELTADSNHLIRFVPWQNRDVYVAMLDIDCNNMLSIFNYHVTMVYAPESKLNNLYIEKSLKLPDARVGLDNYNGTARFEPAPNQEDDTNRIFAEERIESSRRILSLRKMEKTTEIAYLDRSVDVIDNTLVRFIESPGDMVINKIEVTTADIDGNDTWFYIYEISQKPKE